METWKQMKNANRLLSDALTIFEEILSMVKEHRITKTIDYNQMFAKFDKLTENLDMVCRNFRNDPWLRESKKYRSILLLRELIINLREIENCSYLTQELGIDTNEKNKELDYQNDLISEQLHKIK